MTNEYVFAPGLVAAARELIRNEGDGCIVSIRHLLDELSDRFGDWLNVSPDMYKVLDLIETLWDDPHVDQVPNTGWIEFAWNQKGRFEGGPESEFTALLREHLVAQARSPGPTNAKNPAPRAGKKRQLTQ
jgi:hypothetical protein